MSAKRSSEPSPGAFWFLCRHGQRNSPPAGGEIPLRITNPIRILPPHPPPLGAPIPIPSVALRHLPLIRGVGPPRGRLWGEIAPSSVTASPCHLPPRGKAFEGEGPSFVPGGRLEKCGGKLPCEKTDKELMLCRPKLYRSTPNSSSSRTF